MMIGAIRSRLLPRFTARRQAALTKLAPETAQITRSGRRIC